MEWIGAFFGGADGLFSTLGPNAFQANYIVLPSQARSYVNPTVVRTRGQVAVTGENAAGVISNVQGAFGVIPWSDRDDVPPAGGEVPLPFSDPALDWVYHSYLVAPAGSLTGGYYPLQFYGASAVDSKAMRKLGADQGLLFVIENGSLDDMIYQAGFRALVKE